MIEDKSWRNNLDSVSYRTLEKIERELVLVKLAEPHLQLAFTYCNKYYFCVFPCWDWDKPCSRRWQKQSTRYRGEIIKLWQRYPGAMPGIALEKSCIVVIECELLLDGERNFIELCSGLNLNIKDLNPLIVQAPCGDFHYYFRLPGAPLPSHRLATGVNVRCTGAFVPGPRAIRADRMEWKLIKEGTPFGGFETLPLALHHYIYDAFRHNIIK